MVCTDKINNLDQQGAFLPLFAISLLAILAAIGLAVDLGRLETTVRKAQNAVDAAALAGATNLETTIVMAAGSTTMLHQSESDGWANVKKSAILAIAEGNMLSLDATAIAALASQTFRFDDMTSPATDPFRDCPGYRYRAGTRGNLRVKVDRHIFCYWRDLNTGKVTRQKFNIENRTEHFCKANAASVELKISEIYTTFAHTMGIDFLNDAKVSATAYMEEPIPAVGSMCNSVDCDQLGIRDILLDEGLILPGAIPPGITESPCPGAPPPNC